MLLMFSVYIDRDFTFYREYNSSYIYILPQHDLALLSHIMMLFLTHILYCHSPCIHLFYDFIVFRLSPTILTLKWLGKEHSHSLRMALFC
jgi:hypothetical protein